MRTLVSQSSTNSKSVTEQLMMYMFSTAYKTEAEQADPSASRVPVFSASELSLTESASDGFVGKGGR